MKRYERRVIDCTPGEALCNEISGLDDTWRIVNAVSYFRIDDDDKGIESPQDDGLRIRVSQHPYLALQLIVERELPDVDDVQP